MTLMDETFKALSKPPLEREDDMSHTQGKLEVFIGKYNAHNLCRKGDKSHKDILMDVISEKAFANLDEIVRRWNAFEEDGLVTKLLEACKTIETRLLNHGEWDEGCFYYAGTSASALEEPLGLLKAAINSAESQ